MSDLQVLRFENDTPIRYADLNIPLNTNGTFGGNPVFLSDLDKAIQDLVKGLLTIIGTNNLAPNYGTSIKALLNSRNMGQTNTRLLEQIRYLLGYLGTFNANEPASERIDEVLSIKSTPGTQSISLEITLKTGSGTTSTVTLLI